MSFEMTFPVGVLHQRLENGLVLAEGLFYPGLSRLARSPGCCKKKGPAKAPPGIRSWAS